MKRASKTAHYIHGARPEEQERLSLLNEILNKGCLQQMALQGGERILDAGCGLGHLTRLMARAVGPRGSVLGIERDSLQLAAARRPAGQVPEEAPVEFRQGDVLELPLRRQEAETFDLAHARFVLEHVPQPERVIRQMLRAVRPGGRVVLCDDDHSTFRPAPEPDGFASLWRAYVRSYDRLGNDPFVGRRLVSLLHQAGLVQIRNAIVFFGGCAYQADFPLVADNLIGVLLGARGLILEECLLDAEAFDRAIDGLRGWKERPDAALWYGICWAEGIKPAG